MDAWHVSASENCGSTSELRWIQSIANGRPAALALRYGDCKFPDPEDQEWCLDVNSGYQVSCECRHLGIMASSQPLQSRRLQILLFKNDFKHGN